MPPGGMPPRRGSTRLPMSLVRAALVPLVLALAQLAALHGCKTSQPATATTLAQAGSLSQDDYVRNFETIAFYHEFDADKHQRLLTRWEEPLRVALVGDVSPRYVRDTERHLVELALLTGRDIALGDVESANVVVILSPQPFDRAVDTYGEIYGSFFDSQQHMQTVTSFMKREGLCYARILPRPESAEIESAVILIPTDENRFVVRACLIEELTQAMGLFNDSDAVTPSIFNDSSRNMALSDHDRILLRLLYDKRLHPGMTWPQAEPIVRRAVAELIES